MMADYNSGVSSTQERRRARERLKVRGGGAVFSGGALSLL
jgi:hypothetical protein